MPKYIANAYLVHQGNVIQTGKEVELTEEQAKRLGKKVSLVEGTNEPQNDEDNEYTEADLKKMSADEQKEIVQKLEGNLDEITNEDKRIEFILENQ